MIKNQGSSLVEVVQSTNKNIGLNVIYQIIYHQTSKLLSAKHESFSGNLMRR